MNVKSIIAKYRWLIIILCLLIPLVIGWQLKNIRISTNLNELLPDTMSSRIDTKKIEAIFGSSDAMIYIFQTDDVLNPDTLERLDKITQDLKKVKGVKKVLSLSTTKEIISENGSMIVKNAIEKIPRNDAEKANLRKSLMNNEQAYEVVISKDFKATAIILSLETDADNLQIYAAAQKIVGKYPGNEKVSVGGEPAFRVTLQKNVIKDLSLLIPIALILMIIILYSFFRTRRGIILPLSVVLLSIIVGLGLLPTFGWPLTMIVVLLPLMVVAYSNNYGLYLMSRYSELIVHHGKEDNLEIASQGVSELAAPIFFTGLITIAGILGLVFHVLVPARQIAVVASLAIAFSVFASLGGITSVLAILPLPKKMKEEKKYTWVWLDKCLKWLSQKIIKHTHTVLWISLILAVLGLAASSLLKVDTNQEKMFSKNHPIRQCTDLINKNFGGSQNISMVFEGDIKDPVLLRSMEKYKQELLKIPGVGQVTSMADVIKTMSKALYDKNEPGYDKIPETREAVAQFLELYSMSGDPDDFEQIVDFNYSKANFIIRINDNSTPALVNLLNRVHELTKSDPHITMIGGTAVVKFELAETLIKGQMRSIIIALIVIILLVVLLFRSWNAGLLCSVPVILSVIFGFGIMGLFGIRLDIATTLITSVILGTGVDFTVQFLWKYRSLTKEGIASDQAVSQTLATTGRSITLNAICVISGFAALIFASMIGLRNLALLFVIETFVCLIGTLVIMPSLCIVFKPKFLEPLPEETAQKKGVI